MEELLRHLRSPINILGVFKVKGVGDLILRGGD